MFSVKIWGDRGSVPVPGMSTVEFGGNTACLEVRCGKRLIIIDVGSGVRSLGDYLLSSKSPSETINADIFITHTHWDHIMGFPMFSPIYVPGTKLNIYGPVNLNEEPLESIIGEQLSYKYWPVRQTELSAKIKYYSLQETKLDLGDGIIVKTKYLNHPVMCLSYRIEYEGKSLVTAFDHEPFQNIFETDKTSPDYNENIAMEGEIAAKEENKKIETFFRNANILIHDTHYTAKEYTSKKGWGHASYEYAINTAYRAKVKKLICFHHEPNRSDLELQELELFYQNKIQSKSDMELEIAREGKTYIL